MPETSRLYLHSPAGSDVAVYKWPLHVSDSWNEPHEIVETIRWVCNDFPELKLAVENYVLNHFDPASFENMKLLCEKYNRAVDNIRKLWSGRQPPPCIDAPPSILLLKHILNQVYNRAIARPEELNTYQAFSPEVYGETSFELITEMISATHLSENDVFLDLGSGVGQVVLQVAASTGCRSYGIEKAEIPAKYAEEMNRQFVKWMDFYGKSYGDFELLKGDFLDPQFDEIFQSATVIFCNNFAFGPSLNHKLKLKFQNLRDGVKIVSSREFCPLNFRVTERNLSDIGAMMRVAELSPLKGSVSWTSKPVSYYLHKIDRSKMEEFFHKQKHPEDIKSEGSMSFSGGSSSSDTVSDEEEDSSLDSSDDEDLFNKRPSEELRHFPPATQPSKGVSQSGGSYYHQSHPQPHPHHKRPIPHPNNVTTSAVQKKATPPSGLTHLPRPHPQSIINERSYVNSHSGGGSHQGMATNGRQRKKPSQNPGTRGRRTKSTLDMDPLFERFESQMMSYIEHLNNPQFVSWVTDSIEKEKMKKKHLQGVIEHLESEVSSLSMDTISNMKDSMSHLGITNLTPEGLLLGAKDIVMLNRQLRREVQMLEKDVNKLKEENSFITCVCKQADVSVSEETTVYNKTTDARPLLNEKDDVTVSGMNATNIATPTTSQQEVEPMEVSSVQATPPVLDGSSVINVETSSDDVHVCMASSSPPTNVSTPTNVPTPTAPVLPTTPCEGVALLKPLVLQSPQEGVTTTYNTPLSVVDVPSDTSVAPPTVIESSNILVSSSTVVSSSPVTVVTPTINNVKPVSCVTVGEAYSGRVEFSDYEQYQISLETIDQAVLELGPFAKDVVAEQKPDLPPLNWPHPVVEGHIKKDKRKPYSPPMGRMARKGRASGDCMSPLSSVGSPIGSNSGEPAVKHPAAQQRRPSKKKHLPDYESSPLLVGAVSDNETTPILITADTSRTETTSSHETSAVEGMLALSTSTMQRRPSGDEQPFVVTDGTLSATTLTSTGQDMLTQVAPPKVHYPPKVMELSGNTNPSSRRRGLGHHGGSSSSIRSVEEHSSSRNTFSPLPSSLHVPPTKSPDDPPIRSVTKHGSGEDKKDVVNPFWPVSTKSSDHHISVSSSTGLSYPLMTLSAWNTMGGGLHPTYVPPYPSLSRAELSTSSVDMSVSNSFRSSVISPYYFYNQAYPFGLTTPLGNHLITSSSASIQSPSVSSPSLPTAHPSLSFNPYMTPQTLHPLNDSTKPKDIIQPNSTPWMMLGSQFPQNNFLGTNQFTTGLGVAGPHLSLFPGLQPTGMSGLLGSGATPTVNADQTSDGFKKRGSDHHPDTASLMYPALARNTTPGGSQGYISIDEGNQLRKPVHPQFGSISSSLTPSPSIDLIPPNTNGSKREKIDRRKKLKIHQINQEDFSNKGGDKTGGDRRNARKVFTEWEIPPPTQLINNSSTPSHMSFSKAMSDVAPPTNEHSHQSRAPLGGGGMVGVGPPIMLSDTRMPTLVTMSSVEESDPIIKVDDDDEDDVSSEGTVSVAGSPPPEETVPVNIPAVPVSAPVINLPVTMSTVPVSTPVVPFTTPTVPVISNVPDTTSAVPLATPILPVDKPVIPVAKPVVPFSVPASNVPVIAPVVPVTVIDEETSKFEIANDSDKGSGSIDDTGSGVVVSIREHTQEELKSHDLKSPDQAIQTTPTNIVNNETYCSSSTFTNDDNEDDLQQDGGSPDDHQLVIEQPSSPIAEQDSPSSDGFSPVPPTNSSESLFVTQSADDISNNATPTSDHNEDMEDDYVDIGNTSLEYDEFNPEHDIVNQSVNSTSPSPNDTVTSLPLSAVSLSGVLSDSNQVITSMPLSFSTSLNATGSDLLVSKSLNSSSTEFKDKTRKSPKPKYSDHHGERSSSKPRPSDHHDDRHRHQSKHESRRSLTPSNSQHGHHRNSSPIPSSKGRHNEDGTHYSNNSPSKKRSSKSPDKYNVSVKKRDRSSNHAYHHHKIHSVNPTSDGNHETGVSEHAQGDYPSWTVGGANHSLIRYTGSSSSSSSLNEQYDMAMGGAQHVSRKRHDDHHSSVKDGGEVPVTKRHKIKRPKNHHHHHHHHHHNRHTQH